MMKIVSRDGIMRVKKIADEYGNPKKLADIMRTKTPDDELDRIIKDRTRMYAWREARTKQDIDRYMTVMGGDLVHHMMDGNDDWREILDRFEREIMRSRMNNLVILLDLLDYREYMLRDGQGLEEDSFMDDDKRLLPVDRTINTNEGPYYKCMNPKCNNVWKETSLKNIYMSHGSQRYESSCPKCDGDTERLFF